MANYIDSNITLKIIDMPKSERLEWFMKFNYIVQDDSTYWQLLAALWIDSDVCTPDLDKWIELFSSKRRNRQKLMKKGDRHIWMKLPHRVTVYRAINHAEDISKAISWTLDKEVCKRLFPDRPIVVETFLKSEIIAYFDRRKEKEIIRIKKEK